MFYGRRGSSDCLSKAVEETPKAEWAKCAFLTSSMQRCIDVNGRYYKKL
jgi:hypothetical protein